MFFLAKKCVARLLTAIRHLERFLGAPKASLGGPASRRFRCLRQKASSVGIRLFFWQKKSLKFWKYFVFLEFFRFSKVMSSQLGSWWCRRALRGAPRTLRDADKNDKRGQKSSWRPAGVSQTVWKEIYRCARRSRPTINTKKSMILIHKWIGCALPATGDFTRILCFWKLRKTTKRLRIFAKYV